MFRSTDRQATIYNVLVVAFFVAAIITFMQASAGSSPQQIPTTSTAPVAVSELQTTPAP